MSISSTISSVLQLLFALAISSVFSIQLVAQHEIQALYQDDANNVSELLSVDQLAKLSAEAILPSSGGLRVELDELAILADLTKSQQVGRSSEKIATFPLIDGTREQFVLEPSEVMHPDLAAQFPEVLAFRGFQKSNPAIKIRAEYSPSNGWTTAVREPDGKQTLLHTSGSTAASRIYTLVNKKEIPVDNFSCHADADPDSAFAKTGDNTAARFGDCELRRYRLAITCTGEYAVAVNGPNPNAAGVLAAMVVAMNRVNGVYERELGITMQIIANNNLLLFFNGATDPYTEGSPGAMINESQTNIDLLVGSSAYDIGHIFSTQGGGLAQLNSPCSNNKARGVTGVPNPTNDGFYIDYVAHEMGHQFGATHTFYNSCGGNRSQITAYEPGSGSTIMAYAGICSPNVQSNSDDYFHSASIEQIQNFVTAPFSTCEEIVPTNNNAPVVTPGATFTIPVSTAFELTAIASDADGDQLFYGWEQMDNDLGAPMPPNATSTQGPMFRSLQPSTSPTRRFPSGLFPTYEVLPSVARDMNFRVTVRDNNTAVGCTDETSVSVTTAGTVPFRITNFNTATPLTGLETVSLTWQVASTDVAPINTPTVDIYFSVDGGNTYSTTLASDVPNSGTAQITLPNVASTMARFIVKGHNNVFYDINDVNLTIAQATVPTFILDVDPVLATTCTASPVVYGIDITSVLGFSESVTLSAIGLPAGVTAAFTQNNTSGNFSTFLTLSGAGSLAIGTYPFVLQGNSTTVQRQVNLTLVKDAIPASAPMPIGPVDGSDQGILFTNFSWSYNAGLGEVRFQLSGDPSFANVGFQQDVAGASSVLSGIPQGIFYWRVAYVNDCGTGPWSRLQSFRKIPLELEEFSNTTAVPIGSGNPASYSSIIDVTRQGPIYQVEVEPTISHTYVGDLDGSIRFPSAQVNQLFEQPGGGGCRGRDISATFADDATSTAVDFVNTCLSTSPSISGEFRPVDLFFPELPAEGSGRYTLTIDDNASVDGGAIDSWKLRLWYSDTPEYNELVEIDALQVPSGTSRVVASSNLSATAVTVQPSVIAWVVKTLPTAGELRRSGTTLGLGAVVTQAQINAGNLSYTHNPASGQTTDAVTFDLIIAGIGYQSNQILPINIIANNMVVSASITQGLDCFGDSDASIQALATDGTAPYTYSLNGGSFTTNNTFSNLSAGNYVVTARDANGLEATAASLTIANPTQLLLSATASGSTITSVGTGGTGALEYSLDGGPFQASGIFTAVSNGSHSVRVRDANGCITTDLVVVSNSVLIVDLQILQDILCNGGTGSIEANVAGGTGPYTFSLNGGAAQSSPIFDNLPAGQYTVTVTDVTGAMATPPAPLNLTQPDALTLAATVSADNVVLVATGGSSPYSYSINRTDYQASPDFSGLSNGSYTGYVTDANGCTQTTSFQINVNNVTVAVSIVNSISCNGVADGSISATGQGGQAPYTYSLNGGPFQTSGSFTALPAGSYTVTAKDAIGNENTSATVDLIEPAALMLSATVASSTITAIASGGTAPYTYSLNGGAFQSSGVFSGLANGMYTINSRDANGCEEQTTATVSVNNVAVVATIIQQVSCNGDADGEISASASGGQTPYTYSINGSAFQANGIFSNLAPGQYIVRARDANGLEQNAPAVTITEPAVLSLSASVTGNAVTLNATGGTSPYQFSSGGAFQSGATFSGLSNGSYTATVMDGNGCMATTIFTINVSSISVDISVQQPITCNNAADGVIVATAQGGRSPYTYSLNGSAFQSSGMFSNLQPGQFTIVARDADGLEVTSSTITLTNPAVLNISATINGNNVTLTASGGTQPYSYSVDGGASQPSPIFSAQTAGLHTYTVSDANGCTASTTVTITATNFGVSVTFNIGQESCPGSSDGSVTLVGVNGTSPYTYSLDGGSFQSASFFNGLAPGAYTATARDATGALATANFSILARNQPTVDVVVQGSRIRLNNFSGTGGAGILYSFDGGSTFSSSPSSYAYVAGTYDIVIQYGSSCEFTTTATVINPLSVTGNDYTACASENTATTVICVEGGVINYSLTPSSGSIVPISLAGCTNAYELTVPTSDASVTVDVSDQTGASRSVTLLLDIFPTFTVGGTVDGSTLTVSVQGGAAPFTYSLDGGTTTQNGPVFNNLADGPITVLVTDSNGCEVTRTFSVSGVNTSPASIGLQVYPNPTSDVLYVKVDSRVIIKQYEVVNALGRLVLAKAGNEQFLEVSTLAPGIYSLRIKHQEGITNVPVLIAR